MIKKIMLTLIFGFGLVACEPHNDKTDPFKIDPKLYKSTAIIKIYKNDSLIKTKTVEHVFTWHKNGFAYIFDVSNGNYIFNKSYDTEVEVFITD